LIILGGKCGFEDVRKEAILEVLCPSILADGYAAVGKLVQNIITNFVSLFLLSVCLLQQEQCLLTLCVILF
jgi:hypothetical protein